MAARAVGVPESRVGGSTTLTGGGTAQADNRLGPDERRRIDARLRTLLTGWTDSHRESNAEVGYDLEAATDEELISLRTSTFVLGGQLTFGVDVHSRWSSADWMNANCARSLCGGRYCGR
jgi:hypothetical protein